MLPDDLVVFTKEHHAWLVSAGQAKAGPNSPSSRLRYVGRIIEVGYGYVTVRWLGSEKVQKYFPDNLELLRRRS